MADTPKKENPKKTQPAQTPTKISAADADILFEDVKLDKADSQTFFFFTEKKGLDILTCCYFSFHSRRRCFLALSGNKG